MSIDLNWDVLTSGPDGEALAHKIKDFIHDKFQTVPLPRFIKSVNVHSFDFGSICPDLELKDITDPLPDFYDEDEDEDGDEEDDDDEGKSLAESLQHHSQHSFAQTAPMGERDRTRLGGLRPELFRGDLGGHDMGGPFMGTSTPGILGGPGLNYFQNHLGTGAQTPLAAMAGAQAHFGHHYPWAGHPHELHPHSPSHSRNPSQSSISVDNFSVATAPPRLDAGHHILREKSSVSTLAATSVNTSRPPTRDTHFGESAIMEEDEYGNPLHHHPHSSHHSQAPGLEDEEDEQRRPRKEPRLEDVQAVFRIRYAGDIRLNLTAEILLDYPMPSFVGIPLKLNITGLSFDGVGVLAKIRKRLHFCFLSPEDALAVVGPDEDEDNDIDGEDQERKKKPRLGGLLQEIKVESEIGEQEGGKQSLKNVGKVERFVLEQVRRIFEEEFVYPSFWTFLV